MREVIPLVLVLVACGGAAAPVLVEEEPLPEADGAGFVLSLPGDSTMAIVTNQLVGSVVDVVRAPGFDEVITFSATAPDGFIVIFRPTVVIREMTDLLLVAEADVPPGRHLVTIRAESQHGAVQTLSLTVDVAARDG